MVDFSMETRQGLRDYVMDKDIEWTDTHKLFVIAKVLQGLHHLVPEPPDAVDENEGMAQLSLLVHTMPLVIAGSKEDLNTQVARESLKQLLLMSAKITFQKEEEHAVSSG